MHIKDCTSKDGKDCTDFDRGRRHAIKKYQADDHARDLKPKDEYSHKAFWSSVGWEDPCPDVTLIIQITFSL